MIASRASVICCFGLFSIAAQTLLFREYMTAFEGHDIGIGCFFGAWFIWIALGALVVGRIKTLPARLVRITELLLVGYIPAFCLQYALIVFFRDLTGVESYAFLRLQHILGGAVLVTAPVSLLTGVLFPVLCDWIRAQDSLPVGRVYVLEAAGSLVGGLGVTVLIYGGVSAACIFLALATLIGAVATWSSWTAPRERLFRIKRGVCLSCLLLCAGAWPLRVDRPLTQVIQTYRWRQLLPTGIWQGAFVTPQAEYLYGTYQDRWIVMREGSVCEALGDRTEAGRLAAMTLCQNVAAERILVLGDGLEVCRSFLQSGLVTGVDWFHPDPAFIPALTAQVPTAYLPQDERLHCRAGDLHPWLASHAEAYDIVLINLPETTNAAFLRFTTREFLAQVKDALGYGGLVALGFPGGENVQGEELVHVGASLRRILNTQFSQSVLVPGERSFFLCSNLPYLRDEPAVLQRRFQALENAAAICPPEALSILYRPQRSAEIMAAYDQIAEALDPMVNSFSRPHHYLYQLLFLTKQSGLSLLGPVQTALGSGPGLLVVPVVLLLLIRFVTVVRTVSRHGGADGAEALARGRLDVSLLVACAGLVGISTVIILMYLFQLHHGSLYLHVGLISALFMVGLTLGALGIRCTVTRVAGHGGQGLGVILGLSLMLVVLHAASLAGMGWWIDAPLPQWGFGLLLLAGGLFCGCYVPLGAGVFQYARVETASAAGHMQCADHLGAAWGGCLTSLVLIPLFGPQWALLVMAGLVLTNMILLALLFYRYRHPGPPVYAHAVLTPAGYALFAVAACVVTGSYLVNRTQAASVVTEETPYAQAWVEGCRVVDKTVTQSDTAVALDYSEVHRGDQCMGYVFDSAVWSEPVYGYGGPMGLVVFTEPNGVLIDFRVTRSQETPGYVAWLEGWMRSLCGHNLFGPEPLGDVDSISGATLSSEAILTLLRNSGQRFARTVLAQASVTESDPGVQVKTWDWPLVGWAGALVLALGAIYHGRVWTRMFVLAYVVVVSGLWLNRQYALDQVMRLLQGQGLLTVPLASGCLLLGIPLLVIVCGNVYCGYLCPFGALQELLGLIVPKRLKPRLCLATVTWSRFIKYGLLFVLVLAFFLGRRAQVTGLDPLVSFFNLRFWSQGTLPSTEFVVALVVLAGGLFVTRLWCRYLCPTGAFLSLFNVGAWLRWLFPGKKWGRCEFGLNARDNLDCIYCDRCRYQSPVIPGRNEAVTRGVPRGASWVFLAVLIGLGLVMVAPIWQQEPERKAAGATTVQTVSGLQGEPRDVDLKRIEQLIQQGRLSSKEALFYRIGPEDGNRP